jgi:hypothetical protein
MSHALAEALRLLRDQPDPAAQRFGFDVAMAILAAGPARPLTLAEADFLQAGLTAAAPPPAAPDDETRHGNAFYTPEQDAALRRLWLAGASYEAIGEAMGEPGMHRRRIYRRVRRLGLPARPPVLTETGRARKAALMSSMFGRWTPERDEALRAGWAADHTPETIMQAVNALPGDPMTALSVIYDRARKLGLPRRKLAAQASAERLRKMREAYLEKHCVWTEPRDALLIERRDISAAELLPLINALPGEPVRSKTAINTRRHHLRRLGRMPAEPIKLAPPARHAEPAPEPTPRTFAPSAMKTEARVQLLRDLWLDPTVSIADLFTRINALPGRPVAMSARLYGWAEAEGLPTRRPAALAMPSPPPPPPRKAAPDADIPPPREQARAALRDGHSPHVILKHIAITQGDLEALIEEEAALADARIAARREKALDMIRAGAPDFQITEKTGFKLRDIYRFRAELRDVDKGQAA